MTSDLQSAPSSGSDKRRFALGFTLALLLAALGGEAFLRCFPPQDLHPYLGDESPLAGHFRADPDFSYTYDTWQTFADDNQFRLPQYLPLSSLDDGRPVWAFFGNSFVQAPGMLADTARAALPDVHVFNLGKNEELPLRFAQIKLLLENGLRPDRLFVLLMPTDVVPIGQQPLATNYVTPRGARIYKLPHFTPPLDWLLDSSRLALAACVRTGRQRGNSAFNRKRIYEGVDEPLLSDLRFLFGNLARLGRRYDVPITVMLVPAYHQVRYGASCRFQDLLAEAFRREGLDVFDPREVFRNQPDLDGLFIPDLHFSDRGNQILLAELLKHLERGATEVVARRPTRTP